MSWYKSTKSNKKTEHPNSNLSNSTTSFSTRNGMPLNYYDNSKHQDFTNISSTLTIIDMYSENDYFKIKDHLEKIKGINEIKPYYRPKKLRLDYDKNLITIGSIIVTIKNLGFSYVKGG